MWDLGLYILGSLTYSSDGCGLSHNKGIDFIKADIDSEGFRGFSRRRLNGRDMIHAVNFKGIVFQVFARLGFLITIAMIGVNVGRGNLVLVQKLTQTQIKGIILAKFRFAIAQNDHGPNVGAEIFKVVFNPCTVQTKFKSLVCVRESGNRFQIGTGRNA